VGIAAGDEMAVSRYILQRVCEDFQVFCTLHPKPITKGEWNGAGMHVNVSTKKMREKGGLAVILKAINKVSERQRGRGALPHLPSSHPPYLFAQLAAKHDEHICLYGEGNELRLSGTCETASIDEFSCVRCCEARGVPSPLTQPPRPRRYGVANRGCSIRIGRDTEADGKGYFEDRRPASNADPYLVTGKIMDTIMEDVEVPDVEPVNMAAA
jgi:glutamine synthetase